MNLRKIIILFSFATALCACVKENIKENHGPELSLSYSGIEEGEIGLFIQSPISLKNLHGEALNGYCFFDDKIYWPEKESEGETSIVAYLPYDAAYDDQVFGQFDFDGKRSLWIAKNSVPYGQAEAALDFSAHCARIQVYVDKSLEFKEMSIENVYCSVNINFNSGSSSVCGEKGSLKAVKIAENDKLACWEIVLPAQNCQFSLNLDGKYKALGVSTLELQEGKVYSNSVAIVDKESEQKLRFLEKAWADPDFSASIPNPDGVLFTSESRCGVYLLNGDNCSPIYCLGDSDQTASYSMGTNKSFQMINPAQGLYFGIFYSGTLSVERSYSISLGSMGIEKLPASASATVVKKDSQGIWLQDSSNNLGFIITE